MRSNVNVISVSRVLSSCGSWPRGKKLKMISQETISYNLSALFQSIEETIMTMKPCNVVLCIWQSKHNPAGVGEILTTQEMRLSLICTQLSNCYCDKWASWPEVWQMQSSDTLVVIQPKKWPLKHEGWCSIFDSPSCWGRILCPL